jgi:large subunit ribosomal protein L22
MTIQKSATDKSIRISPSKLRRVINQVRGCSYPVALEILEKLPYRGCEPVRRILKKTSANITREKGISENNLFISQIQVDKGPTLKRFRPRAKGRGFPIQKATSQLRIQLQEF